MQWSERTGAKVKELEEGDQEVDLDLNTIILLN